MTDLRQTAQHLAAKGRYGDTHLLHISSLELQGIASLMPGGRLTINPETGLPEAFFFLPFLASLFGAAAPAAAATAAAAPAVLGTLGTAAGTAAGAAGTAAATGLGTLGSTLASIPTSIAHGIGSLFGAGAAAPAAAVDTMTTGAIPAATTAAAPAAAVTGVPPLPAVTNAIPTLKSTLTPILGNPAGQSYAGAGVATQGPAAGVTSALTPVKTATAVLPDTTTAIPTPRPGGLADMGKSVLGWAEKNPMLALGGISALGNMFKGSGKKKDEGDRDPNSLPTYDSSGSPVFPDSGYSAGHTGEWNYFPSYNYRPKYFANGGIVNLADGGGIDTQAQQPQDQSFPLNGVPSQDGSQPQDVPSSPFPTSQIGAQPEPSPDQPTSNDHELIMQAVEALQGKLGDPRPILLAFVQQFGEQALQDLAMKVKGGAANGQAGPPQAAPSGAVPGMFNGGMPPGDGQSDSIPASIDGQQPAALSQGEFVVPADAVSHLGNGSTHAGAKRLHRMVNNVRRARTGTAKAPPRIRRGIGSLMA